jgi:type VI secretion system protein ImpC
MATQAQTDASYDIEEGSLIEQVISYTRVKPADETYDIAKLGVQTLLREIFVRSDTESRIDKRYVENLIDELDQRLGRQVDEILHHPTFKELERPWRSLKFLVDRTEFSENIKIEFISVTKEKLKDDFDDAADIVDSGLYKTVYTNEFGQFGGEPYGVIIGDYEITPNASDMALMHNMASLSAMTHAPFISAAGKEFFGIENWDELANLKNLDSLFEGPQYIKWRSLRDTDDARNLGLTLPNFMLRPTYGESIPVRSFNYHESVDRKNDYLWGNAAFAYATRLTESFASYRWCPNIIGPQSGGAVVDLPVDVVERNGRLEAQGPIEAMISDRKEYELSELGFIPLTLRKESDNAVFFSSSSIQKPKKFSNDEEGRQAELNFRLGTQLPYLFIVNRLAHYVKVLQRENLGSWKSRVDLEQELNKWIKQYVADQNNPSPSTRSQRPLRKAELKVEEVETDPGWYTVSLQVTPHFKFMGANFTLSLSSMLERA